MKRIISLFAAIVLLIGSACADRGTPEIINEPLMPEANALRSCTIRCAGDFVIHDNVLAAALENGKSASAQDKYEFTPMLAEVSEYLAAADFTLANVDGVLGNAAMVKKYGYHGYPAFMTPASLLTAIKGCGIDLLTLSNNHAVDYWFDGLKATVETVEAAGLLHVGGYRTQAERNTPLVVNINGINVGFFNFTDTLNSQENQPSLDKNALVYGVCFTKYSSDYEKEVKRLREAGAEVVVALMHWGLEYHTEPTKSELVNSQKLADAGVDVIIGGHPHNVQRAEWIGDTLCLYSLGNFFSDQRTAGRDCGIIFDFTLEEQPDGSIAVSEYSYTPVWVWRKAAKNGGYEYSVLLSMLHMGKKPEGMSDADYARMLASIGEIQEIMGE